MGAEHSRTGCGAVTATFIWLTASWKLASDHLLELFCSVCFVLDMGVGSLLAFEMMSHIPCWLASCICCISCCFQPWFWAFFCLAWDPIHSSCFEGCLHSAVCLSCTVNVWYYFCKTGIPSKHKCCLLKTNKITTSTQVWLWFSLTLLHPIPASKRAYSEIKLQSLC